MGEIQLTRGAYALVDDEDKKRLAQYHYYLNGHGYAERSIKGTRHQTAYLHHDILGVPPKGMVVDHINRNPLDNRRCNLRFASRTQNRINSRPQRNGTSKYKGVSYHRQLEKWRSCITVDGKTMSLGCYHSEQEAAEAYNRAAIQFYGDYAVLNKI